MRIYLGSLPYDRLLGIVAGRLIDDRPRILSRSY